MCDKVKEVEHALEDVREMLMSSGKDEETWRREFTDVVQDLVKQDAGWKSVRSFRLFDLIRYSSHIAPTSWLTFWRMVSHALQAICSPSDDVRMTLFVSLPSKISSCFLD